MAVVIPTFRCPSDISPLTTGNNSGNANGTSAIAVSSYCGVLGAFDGQWCQVSGTINIKGERNHGLLVVNDARRISEVTMAHPMRLQLAKFHGDRWMPTAMVRSVNSSWATSQPTVARCVPMPAWPITEHTCI